MIVFVQARMSSKRLPGKMGLSFKQHATVLDAVVDPLLGFKYVTGVIVLTSTEASDDPIFWNCRERGYQCFRGELANVYDRFVAAAHYYGVTSFARLCGDSPFVSEEVVSYLITEFNKDDYVYASNTLDRTFPSGLSFEIVNSEVFGSARFASSISHNIEHVTTSFIDPMFCGQRLSLRTTQEFSVGSYAVDTTEDYERLSQLAAPEIDVSRFILERN